MIRDRNNFKKKGHNVLVKPSMTCMNCCSCLAFRDLTQVKKVFCTYCDRTFPGPYMFKASGRFENVAHHSGPVTLLGWP